MISRKGRGRQKWLPLTKETLGLRGIIITDSEETLLDILGFLLPRWLSQYSRSLCIKFLRRLRLNHTSSGRIKWGVTPWGEIRVFIANIIRTVDTLQKIVELCVTILINWSRSGNWGNFYTSLLDKGVILGRCIRGNLPRDRPWEPSALS